MDVDGPDGDTKLLEAASLKAIPLPHLQQMPTPLLVTCSFCEIGLVPNAAVSHAKSHKINLTKEMRKRIQTIMLRPEMVKAPGDISLPKSPCAPIEGLAQEKGYACTLCSYCCTGLSTINNHFSAKHRGAEGTCKDNYAEATVQMFTPQFKKYFAVIPILTNMPLDNLFTLYLKEHVPAVEAIEVLNPPIDHNEVPPLVKNTAWNEHLAAYTGDKQKVRLLLQLLELPTSKRGEKWLGERLRKTVEGYMKEASQMGTNSSLAIRCILMECPRLTQNSDHWIILPEKTIEVYARLLHQWTHAIMLTLEGHESGYTFPLTDEDKSNAMALREALRADSTDLPIDTFHVFIKPLLYPKNHGLVPGSYSKFNEPFECFYALRALRDDGNFQPADMVTQTFAKFKYFIRGTVLYEGLKVSTGDHLAAVTREAQINFTPGTTTPMNQTIDYQRLASSIAMSTASPPITRVSACGMYITYGPYTLSVAKWREALARLADEIEAALDELCLHQDFGLHVPKNTPDDWGNDTRGYSWTKNGTFTEDKRGLLAAMLATPELKLAKVEDGHLKFNHASIWDFIHKCDAVNEKIALLVFLTAGQTPRVSEFIEHKYANSTRPRTFFRDGNDNWFVTRRTKVESRKEKDSFSPIKCYPRLTNITDTYFLVVRPVEAELIKITHGETQYQVYSEYMWTKAGSRVTPEQMRKSILQFNTKYCDVTMGIKDYRQIGVEMVRTFIGSEFEMREEDLDTLAAQANHTLHMTRLRYAPEEGKLPSMSSDLLLRFGRASEAWWEHVGCRPGYPPLLPLRIRQELRETAAQQTTKVPQGGPANAPVAAPVVDTQVIIQAVTSAVVAEVQKIIPNLDTLVRRAVAEALIPI
ncbi:hypothetical protein M413DRAFT_75856, partial [Hebeloma cylindrosporum]